MGRKGKPIRCDKCGFEISSFYFKQHYRVCDGGGPAGRRQKAAGPPKPRIWHQKFVPAGWNKGLNKSDPRVQKYVTTQKEKGVYKKNYQNTLAKWAQNHPGALQKLGQQAGGYRHKSGRSHGAYRKDSFGRQIWLQSSYELRCCALLEELGIRWERPPCLTYVLNGRKRKYFPDFWLTDLGIFLDPKNDYLARKDADKIQAVRDQCGVRIEILLEHQLTKEFLAGLAHSVERLFRNQEARRS